MYCKSKISHSQSQGQRTKGSLNTDYLTSQYLLTLEFTLHTKISTHSLFFKPTIYLVMFVSKNKGYNAEYKG